MGGGKRALGSAPRLPWQGAHIPFPPSDRALRARAPAQVSGRRWAPGALWRQCEESAAHRPPKLSENEWVPVGAREGFLASGLVRKGHTHGPEPAPHHQASPAQTSCPRSMIMPNVTHRKPRQGPPVFTGAAPHPQSTWVALAIQHLLPTGQGAQKARPAPVGSDRTHCRCSVNTRARSVCASERMGEWMTSRTSGNSPSVYAQYGGSFTGPQLQTLQGPDPPKGASLHCHPKPSSWLGLQLMLGQGTASQLSPILQQGVTPHGKGHLPGSPQYWGHKEGALMTKAGAGLLKDWGGGGQQEGGADPMGDEGRERAEAQETGRGSQGQDGARGRPGTRKVASGRSAGSAPGPLPMGELGLGLEGTVNRAEMVRRTKERRQGLS